MEHPIEKIGDHISFSKYKLSSSNLFVFGMNHARGLDEDYDKVESMIMQLVEDNPKIVVLKEGINVDESNMPQDESGKRMFLALKYQLDGMEILAGKKQKKMQGRLFGKLEGKGIKVLNADVNLSTLVRELKAEGLDPAFLEDSMLYKIGLKGEIDFNDLRQKTMSDEQKDLNKKIDDKVFINIRNEIAAKKVREQLEQGSDCVLLYGNEHIPGIISNIFK